MMSLGVQGDTGDPFEDITAALASAFPSRLPRSWILTGSRMNGRLLDGPVIGAHNPEMQRVWRYKDEIAEVDGLISLRVAQLESERSQRTPGLIDLEKKCDSSGHARKQQAAPFVRMDGSLR